MPKQQTEEKLKKLAEGHRERMRKRYLAGEPVNDTEFLEMLLFYVVPRRDTRPIARLLLGEFLSLAGVLDAEPEELKKIDGVGENAAAFLKILRSAVYRYKVSTLIGGRDLSRRSGAVEYLKAHLDTDASEQFRMLALDNACRLIRNIKLAEGTSNRVEVDVAKLCRSAAACGASGVIMAHNHPSGSAEPSLADNLMTEKVAAALAPLGIRLYDHIIIARGEGYYSYHDQTEFKYLFYEDLTDACVKLADADVPFRYDD